MARLEDGDPSWSNTWCSAKLAWRKRWLRLLSVSCARSFASSLVALPTASHALGGADGCAPDLPNLFAEQGQFWQECVRVESVVCESVCV